MNHITKSACTKIVLPLYKFSVRIKEIKMKGNLYHG